MPCCLPSLVMSAIAIDFGTSNTVVSWLDPTHQTPQTLQLPGISRLLPTATGQVSVIPTLVSVWPDRCLIGEPVRAERLGFAHPDRYFQCFKREMVADFQSPPRYLDHQAYSSEQIAELFLQGIWQRITPIFQPSQVIFTVPVGAFERYLDWFREVADRLQLPAVRLVDESTAAALGYAVQRPATTVLVLDFGGGTLDLSLVRTATPNPQATVLQADVIAKSDAYVGGIDIDCWLVEDYLRHTGLTRSQVGPVGWQSLLEIAERLKITLSYQPEATDSWLDDETFTAYEFHLTQTRLSDILEERQLIEQVRQALDEVLAIARNQGVRKADIEQVLLVGGSCQIPAIQTLVSSYFGRSKVQLNKPFEAISHGALALSQVTQLDDYLRHTYAIRLWEPYSRTYSYYPLFEPGTHYPCQRSELLTLQVASDGQSEIRLDIGEIAAVFQAEVFYDAQGRMSSSQLNAQESYRSLNSNHSDICIAYLDPPGQVGRDRITVEFAVNTQRTLIATVRDLLTHQVLLDHAAIANLQ